jgi:hypothetical protein
VFLADLWAINQVLGKLLLENVFQLETFRLAGGFLLGGHEYMVASTAFF